MVSAEERQIFASLSEFSKDIESHLTLIGELTLQRDEDTRAPQQLPQIAHKR